MINCRNGSKYLKKAINSIYAQSFQDWEIIFYNNNMFGVGDVLNTCLDNIFKILGNIK